MTDSEKIDRINQRIKRMEINSHIQTAIVIIGFLGILTFSQLVNKVKDRIILKK